MWTCRGIKLLDIRCVLERMKGVATFIKRVSSPKRLTFKSHSTGRLIHWYRVPVDRDGYELED